MMITQILKWILISVLIAISTLAFAQHPADTFPIVSLCNMDLNRVGTKLSTADLNIVSPAVTGYKWNNSDATTLRWRPQGITGTNVGCKEFSIVSWYGRNINNSFPCTSFNADYRNRGSRVSFVDISDMDSIRYRHVLLVDENYNTFYDMHAGGLVILNDTLYVPDSRGTIDAMYAFPLNGIKEVPNSQLTNFYNYRYILTKAASPTDSMPINPSFVSYDWDEQALVSGTFQNCTSNNCANPQNNRMLWYTPNNVDRTTPFYDGLFGKMQGIGTANNLDDPNKKDVWVATSYGSGNNSRLYAFTYDFGINSVQNQSINLAQNYAYFSLPPGLEDIHMSPSNDTIWTLTEFSPDHPACTGSSNERFVFGLLRNDVRPPSACSDTIAISQFDQIDTSICTPTTLTYVPQTNYVAFASFDKSDETWIQLDALSDTLTNSNRSAFMWLKQTSPVSSESQMLFAINTATGGNICNLQVGTNQKVGVFDGSSSTYGTTSVTDGQWHHVGYTYNEVTGETRIYVDEVQEAIFNNTQSVTNTSLISMGQEFDSGLSKGNYLEGKVTEVTIWNEVLNSADIALLMNTTVSLSHPKRANLMGYYPMNKTCGDNLTIVEDISGNNFNGNASGTIGTNGVDVQSIKVLEQIPGFNSVDHFNIDWQANGASISMAPLLVLNANTYTTGNYNVIFTRSPFVITDNWDININYTSATDVQMACNSYTWIDGNTYTANNNSATDTLTNVLGCDSIVRLDLTILNSTSSTDVQMACNSYTWIDGNTYTANNNSATDTLTNSLGCDSIVRLDLTILNSTSSTDVQMACNSYTWIDGNTYTANNNSATDTLTNVLGCDSIVRLDLTILNSTSSTDVQMACNSYTWIDGNTYTTNNNSATDTLTNALGCDSIVTLDLTVTTIDTSVSLSGITISSNENNATYQWFDCNMNTPITGATNQSYTPTSNGLYAVEIIQNGCIQNSVCTPISILTINSNSSNSSVIKVFPNPTKNGVNIDFESQLEEVQINIIDMAAKVISRSNYKNQQQLYLEMPEIGGVYVLEILTGQQVYHIKVIKE